MPPNLKDNNFGLSYVLGNVSRGPVPMRENPACTTGFDIKQFNRRSSMLPQFARLYVHTNCDKVPFEPNSPASNCSWSGALFALLASNRGEIFPRLDKNTQHLMEIVSRESNQRAADYYNEYINLLKKKKERWNPSPQLADDATELPEDDGSEQSEDDVSENTHLNQNRFFSNSKLSREKQKSQLEERREEIIKNTKDSRLGVSFCRQSNKAAHQQCSEVHGRVNHLSAWR